jgi:hypothetical protein
MRTAFPVSQSRSTVGFPGTLLYLGATVPVTFALIAYSNVLQRQLPERIAGNISQQK